MSNAITATTSLVEAHRGAVYADSQLVARKFGMKHNRFLEKVDAVLQDYPDLRGRQTSPKSAQIERFYTEERTYRKQPYTAYLMNRPFFSLVAMRCETKKAREWQRTFNAAFYSMEQMLIAARSNQEDPQWLVQRANGKVARLGMTDAVKRFVDYATAQGSGSARHYYTLVTDATYKSLGLVQHKVPNLRDTLSGMDVAWLVTTESIADAKFHEYMDVGMHYKLIYKRVAEDLTEFCKPLLRQRKRKNDCRALALSQQAIETAQGAAV